MTSEPTSPDNPEQDSETDAAQDNVASPLIETAAAIAPGAELDQELKSTATEHEQALAALPQRDIDSDADDDSANGPEEPSEGCSVPLSAEQLENILEASLLVASRALSLGQLEAIFEHDDFPPSREEINEALAALHQRYEGRGIELSEVATGYRLQSRQEMSPWIGNLFQEKSPRYSRALLETLVLIAYRQPITRGEIEEVRGVAVSTNIIRTLLEREWVKVVGHRDVPGRPAIYGTTRQFLDYFDLAKIGELPTLSEIKELDQIAPELAQEVAMLEAAVENEAEEQSEGQAEGLSNDSDAALDSDNSAELSDDADSLMSDSEEPNAMDSNSLQSAEATDSLSADEGLTDEGLTQQGSTDETSSAEGLESGADSAAHSADGSAASQALAVEDDGDLRLDEQELDSPEIDVDLSIADEADMPDMRESTIDAVSAEAERDLETLH